MKYKKLLNILFIVLLFISFPLLLEYQLVHNKVENVVIAIIASGMFALAIAFVPRLLISIVKLCHAYSYLFKSYALRIFSTRYKSAKSMFTFLSKMNKLFT